MDVSKGALKWFTFIMLHRSTDMSKSAIIQKHILVQDINTLLHYLNESFLCHRLTSIVLVHSFKLLVKASKYILNSDSVVPFFLLPVWKRFMSLRTEPVAGFCEHSNEPSVFIKGNYLLK
jgi:hypothetical protein